MLFISFYLISLPSSLLEITAGRQMAGPTVAQISTHTHTYTHICMLLVRGTCLSGCPMRTPGKEDPTVSSARATVEREVLGDILALHVCPTVDKSPVLGPSIVEPSLNSYALEFFFKSLGDRNAPKAF